MIRYVMSDGLEMAFGGLYDIMGMMYMEFRHGGSVVFIPLNV